VGDVGFWGAIRAFLKLMRGTHLELPSVRQTGGRLAEIEFDGTIAIEADGYMLEGNGPIAAEVLPGALRLACPAQVSAEPRDARTPPWPVPAAP
jgi:diacylglycerol kinase family enzyme